MRKKTLAESLREAEGNVEYHRGQYNETRIEADTLRRERDALQTEVRGSISVQRELCDKLFEITRWLINNQTATYPFQSDKTQRQDGYRSNGY